MIQVVTKNNMICDLETGVCGVAGEEEFKVIDLQKQQKKIDLYYVTDPICSHCWGLEPVLRRFKEQYGHYLNFHTVMGGLLEKWDGGPVDPGNGIFGPKDVAGHWREVGKFTRMPIDGSLMIDNPVQSSYPPSRVYKVVQNHYGNEKADEFLRRAREALFAFNQNIGESQVLTEIVNDLGLDGEEIIKEAESEVGEDLLKQDFKLAAELGVRGFPTIIMLNENNKAVKIVGSRPLVNYIAGLSRLLENEDLKPKTPPSLENLLEKEKLLFAKEIEVMYDLQPAELATFIKENLAPGMYEEEELLGEKYYVKIQ